MNNPELNGHLDYTQVKNKIYFCFCHFRYEREWSSNNEKNEKNTFLDFFFHFVEWCTREWE